MSVAFIACSLNFVLQARNSPKVGGGKEEKSGGWGEEGWKEEEREGGGSLEGGREGGRFLPSFRSPFSNMSTQALCFIFSHITLISAYPNVLLTLPIPNALFIFCIFNDITLALMHLWV